MPGRKSKKARAAKGVAAKGAAKRVADHVQKAISLPDPGAFVCPYCRCALNWRTVGTTETD